MYTRSPSIKRDRSRRGALAGASEGVRLAGGGGRAHVPLRARAAAPLAPVVLVGVRVARARLVPVGQARRGRGRGQCARAAAPAQRQRRLVAQRRLVRAPRAPLRVVAPAASAHAQRLSHPHTALVSMLYCMRGRHNTVKTKELQFTERRLAKAESSNYPVICIYVNLSCMRASGH